MGVTRAENTIRIVVIGAGQAGFSICAKLRALGVDAHIRLIGDEGHLPYQRPPLSKAYLLGKTTRDRLYLRPQTFYEDQHIRLHLNNPAEKIEREDNLVLLKCGAAAPYEKLVLATGAQPIRLPDAVGGDLDGVHYVRGLADADRMALDVQSGRKVLIVGGGYIGLEAAAVAAERGLSVVLVEAGDRILQRVAAPETSAYFRELHKSHGVDIREGVKLDHLVGAQGGVTGAVLSDGTDMPVDLVIVGIGIRPNQRLAEESGLEIENGIKVDEFCRTSDPDILAVGDCTSFPYGDDRLRLESVGNAIDQAGAAAGTIAGLSAPYHAKPWFWSDQYDTKLQIAGLSHGYDKIIERRAESTLSFWYYAGTRLLAVDAMNDPRAYMVGKRLLEAGINPAPSDISNPQTNLASLMK